MSNKVSAKSTARSERSAEKARAVANKKAWATGDSFTNFAAKLGVGTDNLSTAGTYGFNPVSRERTLLEWMHRGSWVCGLAVDIQADDMTRAGVEILGTLKPAQIELIEELATSLNIWGAFRDAEAWARLYGGAVGVHMVSGQDYSTPLRVETVDKGQYKGILVLDRWQVQPSIEDLVSEEGPFIGLPKFYTVVSDAPGLRGKRIHYSRLFRLEGTRLPYWQRVAENFWGISVLERVYDRLIAFDSATQGASQLVYKSYLRVFALEDLRESVMAGGEAAQGIMKYLEMMARFQTIEGVTLLDAKDKFEAHTHGAFSGLADILVHFGQQISGAIETPLVRLFGQSPSGLNSSGESDIRNYYDGINSKQVGRLKVPVTLTYRLLAMSLGIKPPKGYGVKFRPLWLLSEKERGEIASSVTDTVAKAMDSVGLPQQTALKELRQSSAVTGIFTNITDEDIEAAEELPAPPIPEEVAETGAAAKEKVAEEKAD